MQPRFEISVFSIDIDLHVFADPDAPHFRHSKMPHRITHRVALRIEHRRLRHNDDFCFHPLTIFAVRRTNKCNPESDFSHNFSGLFVFARTKEHRLTQFPVSSPLGELDLSYEHRIYPMHFAHHRWRDVLQPFPALF